MKKKLLNWKRIAALAILPLGFALHSNAQTSVKVVQHDGTETVYSIASDGNMHFENGNLVVKLSGSSTATTTSLAVIRKIVFTDETVGINDPKAQQSKYAIYPNPTSNFFKIEAPEGESLNVVVVNVSGRKIVEGFYKNGNTIDLSRFETGIYFVKINNQNFKLIKQ